MKKRAGSGAFFLFTVLLTTFLAVVVHGIVVHDLFLVLGMGLLTICLSIFGAVYFFLEQLLGQIYTILAEIIHCDKLEDKKEEK